MNEQWMSVSAIETPAVIVYMNALESNIAEMSRLAREAGIRLRPHTKIHECPEIAGMQIAGGACGIEVGAIERALCMADAGIHPLWNGDNRERNNGFLCRSIHLIFSCTSASYEVLRMT